MSIKQFLKPDWRKIVIFVIILVFSLIDVYLFNRYGKSVTVIEGVCTFFEEGEPECEFSLNLIFWIISYMKISGGVALDYFDILINSYFIQFVYWYLISCLIVWIYDKVKKKK